MNNPAKAILIAAFAATLELSTPAGHAQDTLTISCAAPHLPSQQAVAKALDLHNFGQVYRARDSLMRFVHRACTRGAGEVLVSNDQPEGSALGSHAGPRMAGTTSRAAPQDQH